MNILKLLDEANQTWVSVLAGSLGAYQTTTNWFTYASYTIEESA